MLAITINDEAIDLTPGTRLRYTMDNPIFDPDGLPRGYSFPFRIPDTPKNLRILGYANRLDIRAKARKYNSTIRVQGIPIDSGIAQITGGSSSGIEIVIKNEARDLLDEMSKIRLRDIVGTINIPDISGAGVIRYFLEDTSSWTIKIDDNTFTYDSPGATQADGQLELITQINAVYTGLAAPFSTDHIELLTNQYPDLNYKVSEWINVTYVSGEYVHEGNQSNIQAFVNALMASPRDDITFPTCYAFYFHDSQVPSISQFLNYYHNGNNIDNVATATKDWNHSYVPFIRIRHLLNLVITQLGYNLNGDLYQSDWLQQLIYYTNKSLDDLLERDFGPGLNYFNQHLQSISLKDYIPDLTGTELFEWIKFLNYYFEIEGNELRIESRVKPLRQPPIDWTRKSENTYSFDLPEFEGYRLEYATIENELDIFDNQIQTYGSGENIYPFPVRPFYTGLFGNSLGGSTWALIGTNKNGNSQTIGLETENDIRIALDRGQQQDQGGNNYVYASANDQDSFGNATYTSSLLFEGDNGVFKAHWEGWIEMVDAPVIRRRVLLGVADILELKKWRNPLRFIYDPQGAVVAVIKRVSLQIDENGLGLADIEFIQK